MTAASTSKVEARRRAREATRRANEARAARAGLPASITIKMNSLSDERMIEALYDASRAGVEVDVMRPAVGLRTPPALKMVKSGRPRLTQLKALNASRRS